MSNRAHPARSDRLVATDLAAELLGTAMRDSEGPVMQLAGALARMHRALNRADRSSPDCECRNLRNEIALCIQSLQFHDRLIQQLTAVQRLMGSPAAGQPVASGFMPAEGSVELF